MKWIRNHIKNKKIKTIWKWMDTFNICTKNSKLKTEKQMWRPLRRWLGKAWRNRKLELVENLVLDVFNSTSTEKDRCPSRALLLLFFPFFSQRLLERFYDESTISNSGRISATINTLMKVIESRQRRRTDQKKTTEEKKKKIEARVKRKNTANEKCRDKREGKMVTLLFMWTVNEQWFWARTNSIVLGK